MKGLSLAVMLATVLAIVCAIKMTNGYEIGYLKTGFENIERHFMYHDRYGRQATNPNCTKARQEVTTGRFLNCYNTLRELNDDDLTNDELKTFCDADCTSEIISVSEDIAKYCRGGHVSFFRLYVARVKII